MCGRYAASRHPDDLVEEFEVVVRPETVLEPDYNVAPTKDVYAVIDRLPRHATRDDAVRRELTVLRWGLVPSWAKDPSIGSRLINARMETVAEKPAFRKAFAARRCLLPADGYYEWYSPSVAPTGARGRPLKQPFFIHPADGGVLAMAGLYDFWRDPTRPDDDVHAWLVTATILTTTAEDALGVIHDRMPLLVERDHWSNWLDPTLDGSTRDLTELLVPAAPGRLDAYPVSTQVNAVRNNGAQLLDPLEAEPHAPDDDAPDDGAVRPRAGSAPVESVDGGPDAGRASNQSRPDDGTLF
jgi:putative SOS response-associated peptidase YedK